MIDYRKATPADLEQIWDRSIADNPGDPRYIRWKQQFIEDNLSGRAATFVVCIDDDCVGEGTLLLSPACRAVRGRTELCDGNTRANINALRIREEYEGRGHISKLMTAMEGYACSLGLNELTIGVEETETRNRRIYTHWGFDRLVLTETEEDTVVLYYAKDIS